MRQFKNGLLPVFLAVALLAVACGGDDGDGTSITADMAMNAAVVASDEAAEALDEAIAVGGVATTASQDAATGIADAAAAVASAQAALAAAEAAQEAANEAGSTASGNEAALIAAQAALEEARAAADEALVEAKLARAEAYEARSAASVQQTGTLGTPAVADAGAVADTAPADTAPADTAPADTAPITPDSAGTEVPAPVSIPLDFLVIDAPGTPASFWDDAILRATERFPQLTINKLVLPHHQAESTLRQLAESGRLPDVMISNSLTPEFIEQGLLLPFEPTDLERFTNPVGLGLSGGRQYVLPALTVFESGVFYNKDIFDAAGITSEPQTWAEFVAAAEAVAALGGVPFVAGGAGPFLAGGSSDDRWAAAWPVMSLVSLNVTGVDPAFNTKLRSGEASFTDPLFVESLRLFETLVRFGWLPNDALSLGYTDLQERFLEGTAAMYPMGGFFVESIPADHPFAIGVFPMPTVDGSRRLATYTKSGPVVSATTANPELARLFAVEIATNLESMLQPLLRDASVPNTRGFALPPNVQPHPLVMDVVDILADPAAQHVPFFTFEVGDNSLVPGFQDELFQQVEEMLAGKSAGDAARALQAAWSRLAG